MEEKRNVADVLLKPNPTVDFLKGVAILFVIFTHFSWEMTERTKLLFPFWIDMAVPIFMFLSGYVNALSSERKNEGLESSYQYKKIVTKLIRYSMPFIVLYILEQILFYIRDYGYTPYEKIMQLFNGGVGQGSYYFPIMIQFIFLFPIIYCIIKKYKTKGLLICFCMNALYEILKCSYMMNLECYRVLVFRYIFVIAAGCFCAMGYEVHRIVSIFSVVIGLMYIYLMGYTDYSPVILTYWSGRTFIACLLIVPIISIMVKKARIHSRFIGLLGKASYNILFVQLFYYLAIADNVQNYISNRWIQLVVAIAFSCIVGVVFYKIEFPLTKKLVNKIVNQKELQK